MRFENKIFSSAQKNAGFAVVNSEVVGLVPFFSYFSCKFVCLKEKHAGHVLTINKNQIHDGKTPYCRLLADSMPTYVKEDKRQTDILHFLYEVILPTNKQL
jgi:hypothetical protein